MRSLYVQNKTDAAAAGCVLLYLECSLLVHFTAVFGACAFSQSISSMPRRPMRRRAAAARVGLGVCGARQLWALTGQIYHIIIMHSTPVYSLPDLCTATALGVLL